MSIEPSVLRVCVVNVPVPLVAVSVPILERAGLVLSSATVV